MEARGIALQNKRVREFLNMYRNGLWGLIVLVADIWAIVSILQSSATTGSKVVWTVVVIVLPVLGFILWFLFGPKSARG